MCIRLFSQDELTYEEKGSKLGFVSALLWSLRQQGSEKIVLVSISTQVLDLLAGPYPWSCPNSFNFPCNGYFPWIKLDTQLFGKVWNRLDLERKGNVYTRTLRYNELLWLVFHCLFQLCAATTATLSCGLTVQRQRPRGSRSCPGSTTTTATTSSSSSAPKPEEQVTCQKLI